MQVTEIRNSGGAGYDSFLVDSLGIGKSKKSSVATQLEEPAKQVDKTAWQKDILSSAISRLENNMQVEDKSPLNYATAAPIETYQEALGELKNLISNNFAQYAAKAQANLTPQDILYLFEEEQVSVV